MTTKVTSAKESVAAPCWSCGAVPGKTHFCAACGKIQPLAGADYFALLGLPRKLGVDADELERRFHQLSWKLHPDNFMRAAEYEREISLERSSQLNDAFRALREPVGRVEYLLGTAGMRREGQQKQQAPPELLEEVFELNESLDELREARQSAADSAGVRRKLEAARLNFEAKMGEVDRELKILFGQWDREWDQAGAQAALLTAAQTALLERMNEVLNRRSYIRNLVASVQKELAEG